MKKFFALALICALVLALVPSVALADATSDLQTALNNGGTVTLSDDIVLTAPLTIPAGVSVTLDLNGKTLSQSLNLPSSQAYSMITNNGSLTVQDSAGGGKISFTNIGSGDPSFGKGYYTVANRGTMAVNGGTIENLSNISGMYSAIDNYAGGLLTVNGGTVSCPNYCAIRLFATSESVDNTVEIKGGTVSGKFAIFVQDAAGGAAHSKASLSVEGGSIEGSKDALYLWDAGSTTSMNGISLDFAGGEVEGSFTFSTADDSTLTDFISGGRYSEQPDASFVKDDQLVIDTNDGSDTPFVIGDDAEKALANAAPGSTIDIYSAPAGTTITVPAGVTVNVADGAQDNVVVEYVSAPAAPAEVPETGDHDLPILCAVLALLSLIGMGLVKRVSNRI